MKKIAKTMSLMTITALLVLVPDTNALTASANGITYSMAYVESEGEWRYQEGADFDADGKHYDADDINDKIEDDDLLVIYGNSEHPGAFDISAHLSNLTILGAQAYVVVATEGITDFYASYGSVAAVSGDIQNASIYDDAQVTFNCSIGNLNINAADDSYALATCKGSVGHAIHQYEGYVFFDIYNIEWGEFKLEEGTLITEEKYYSTTPNAVPSAPAPDTSTPAGTPTADITPQNSPTSAGDYDDVPKTGESYIVCLLLGIALVSFAGSISLKRA